MAYTLFTANRNYSSWSLRPWVLMRGLGIDFEDRLVPFGGPDNSAEFRNFAPNGKVPCLHDDGTIVWDSLAIVEYLAERHQGVWPADNDARAWARCAAAEMHSGFSALRNICPMSVGVRAELQDIPPALQADIDRIAEIFREGLERFGGPWLAGAEFSAVDAFFAPVAFRVRTFGLDIGDKGRGWVGRMLGHPDMLAWETAALAETWRDPAHEDEIAAVATVAADYRRQS
ncbi:glutathione S-transferase family protein [Blastomonas sp.]|uniref:glutathione S-transferase family protein n=1 Tax=Blastomonas sp. TaxID=1909299 RepID=UPI002601794F|nr:glutathione S-transferase family protein [Blastomonas sp.]MDM7957844.1 glutathione S-transferase family protein [Blastomonas sp.]